MLFLKLDCFFDFVIGLMVVDFKGYLIDFKSMKINSDVEIFDIKKVRLLFKFVI